LQLIFRKQRRKEQELFLKLVVSRKRRYLKLQVSDEGQSLTGKRCLADFEYSDRWVLYSSTTQTLNSSRASNITPS